MEGEQSVASSLPNNNSLQQNSYHSNALNKQEPDPEPDIDFFQDMQPRIKKAQKVNHETQS